MHLPTFILSSTAATELGAHCSFCSEASAETKESHMDAHRGPNVGEVLEHLPAHAGTTGIEPREKTEEGQHSIKKDQTGIALQVRVLLIEYNLWGKGHFFLLAWQDCAKQTHITGTSWTQGLWETAPPGHSDIRVLALLHTISAVLFPSEHLPHRPLGCHLFPQRVDGLRPSPPQKLGSAFLHQTSC